VSKLTVYPGMGSCTDLMHDSIPPRKPGDLHQQWLRQAKQPGKQRGADNLGHQKGDQSKQGMVLCNQP
jgi:hypothetical protein